MSKLRIGSSLLSLAAVAVAAAPAHAAVPKGVSHQPAVYALANGCHTIAPSGGASAAGPYAFKATGLGTFMLMDAAGRLLGVRDGDVGPIGGIEAAGPAAEWAPRQVKGHTFTIRSTSVSGALTITTAGAPALAAGDAPRLMLASATGCTPVPEAEVGATGTAPKPTRADGTVVGFADTHLHITGAMRAGGAVMGGEVFDRFGIARALGDDAAVHGADGGLDATGNLLRKGVPFGTHATDGWPTFAGWPTNDTNTHQQVYFAWLQRAWRAGLRLTVAETVEDSLLCKVEPRRRYGCDETSAIRRQVRVLHDLQDYVDAQSGGPGRGWLRIVESPAAARRAIKRGQLAVVIGMESSFPLDCRDQPGRRPCTTKQVDRRLDALYAAGIRSMFIAHWADNGFAGAAVEGGVKGKFINALQRVETGHFFKVGRCPNPGQGEQLQALSALEIQVVGQFFPAAKSLADAKEPTYPTGARCNVRGLTKLGAHLVRRMIAKGMLIEMDHMSERARDQVLRLAERAHYPVVSGHSDTGGTWTTGELRRLTKLGGVASQRLADPATLAKSIVARTRYQAGGRWFGVGLGTDTGGFATLPGAPAAGTTAVTYPFHVNGSSVTFTRQVTGTRTFDFNIDGMAHYGLLPDLLAAMARAPQGRRATALLFRSAEGYLRMWELAQRRR